ncbi:G5 domain-containing protein [Sanguibacter sp. A247]|uniref:aggregation-promoting factor C-terminal-like domain-containing protein n=1 Tax=unclassified Sanguibacter TaxID=2645534 RepID=UPI003FD7CB1B
MRSHRPARVAVSLVVVLIVAAATTFSLRQFAPDGVMTFGDPRPVVAATERATSEPTPASRSTDRGPVVAVDLVVDGVEHGVVTSATDVTGLLVEQGIVLGTRAVSHDLDAPVVSGMRVEVVEVTWTHETVEVDVEPELTEVDDATLAEGTRRVVSHGTPGRSVSTFLVASIDGVESSRAEVVSVVLREPVAGSVRVGTRAAEATQPAAPRPTTPAPRPTTPAPAPTTEPAGPGNDEDDDDEATTPSAEPSEPSPEPSTAEPEPAPAPSPEPSPEPTAAPSIAPPGTPGTTPSSAKAIAKRKVAARGWKSAEYSCLVTLWERESNWSYKAANPWSTARGIPQAIMSIHFGSDWRTNEAGTRYLTTPSVQIDWGLRYISGRYGTPCKALDFSDRKGYY